MRITYRTQHVKKYWTKRWDDIPADAPMENADVYPLKYAELTIKFKDGRILEAGCGAGRILRYYKNRGYDIVGIDFIKSAVEKLKEIDPELNVEVGDITRLRFEENSFKYVLSFGLYHNLEHGLDRALRETYRVLEPGGKVCASFRADNIQTRLADWLADYRRKKQAGITHATEFHKMNLKRSEFVDIFNRAGFKVEKVYHVENMPIFYKFRFFRSQGHKIFNENMARKEGYKLSVFGNTIQNILIRYFPAQFCNIYVAIAQKPER